jgi:hypothetical protein
MIQRSIRFRRLNLQHWNLDRHCAQRSQAFAELARLMRGARDQHATTR